MTPRKLLLAYVLAAATALCFRSSCNAADDPVDAQEPNDPRIAELRNEVFRGFENFNKRFRYVEGAHSFKTVYEGKSDGEGKLRFIRSGCNILEESVYDDGRKPMIYGINKKYFFILLKDGDSYVLDHVEKIDSPITDEDFLPSSSAFMKYDRTPTKRMTSGLVGDMTSGYQLSGLWIFILLENPTLKIESYEQAVDEEGENVVKVSFSCEESLFCRVVRGKIEFLPDQYWQIRRATAVFAGDENESTLEYVNSYSQSSETSPYTTAQEMKKLTKDFTASCVSESSRLPKPLKDSRFTLSYYGLPEPKFDEEPVGRERYFVLLVGLVLIAAATLRAYKNRRANADA